MRAAQRPDDEPGEAIEAYLDELFVSLKGPARYARRVLAEVEAHLRDATDARVARGESPSDAEKTAVAAFGNAPEFAGACARVSTSERIRAFMRDLRTPAVVLVGIGLVAIGLSGVVDRILQAGFGARFVFADPPGATYSASDCHYWQSIHPSAGTCAQAYLDEATADGLAQRFAVGVVGVVILAVYAAWARRRVRPLLARREFTSTVAASVFGTAGLLLVGNGIDQAARFGANGPGQWISAGGIALAVAIASIVMLVRSWHTGEPIDSAASRRLSG